MKLPVHCDRCGELEEDFVTTCIICGDTIGICCTVPITPEINYCLNCAPEEELNSWLNLFNELSTYEITTKRSSGPGWGL